MVVVELIAHLWEVDSPRSGSFSHYRGDHEAIAPEELIKHVPWQKVLREHVVQGPNHSVAIHVGLDVIVIYSQILRHPKYNNLSMIPSVLISHTFDNENILFQ